MDYMNDLHELCESISRAINTANEKIRGAGGKLSAADVDYIDKLTHSLKSVKAVIAMMDDEDASSYSDGSYGGYRMRGYSRNGYNDGSFRGRGRYAKRDSMGRYSSDDGVAEELRGLMNEVPNESIKRDIQRIVEKMEQM